MYDTAAQDDGLSMTSIVSASSQATTRDTWTPYRASHNKQEHVEKKEQWIENNKANENVVKDENNEPLSSLPSYNEVVRKYKQVFFVICFPGNGK